MGEQDTPSDKFETPDPDTLNELLSGYEISDLIARGGMGAVYRARQVSLQREVAIKVLPHELSQLEKFHKSFKAEARAMAKLSHPNLIGVYDFGEVAGMLYLVMEIVNGESLYEAAYGEMVDPLQAVEIVRGVAAGLGHAHAADILHRDIKLANILISHELEPKLGDFGLAVPADDVASGMVMGTPGYLAPEVLQDFNSATPASDVFSLGMILHELLTGVTPTGEEPANLELVPNLRDLRHLILKAIDPNPVVRFNDGKAMAEALGTWLEEAARLPPHVLTAANRPGAATPLGGTMAGIARRPIPMASTAGSGGGGAMAGIGGIVLVLLTGAVLYFIFAGGDEDPDNAGGGSAPPSSVPEASPTDLNRPGSPPAGPETRSPDRDPTRDPPKPPARPDFSLSAHRKEMQDALGESRAELITARTANLRDLKSKSPSTGAWTDYFALVDEETGELPRYLTGDEPIAIDETMADLLNKYAMDEQEELDRIHLDAVRKLHRKSVAALKVADALPKGGHSREWETWVEWLGENPLELLAFDPTGKWEQSRGSGRGTTLVISCRGTVTIASGAIEIKRDNLLSRSRDGQLTIIRTPDDHSSHWTLRWHPPVLVGEDETGEVVEFRRLPFDFSATSRSSDQPAQPKDYPDELPLADKDLADLRAQFRMVLKKDLEKYIASYLDRMRRDMELADQRKNWATIRQLEREIARVEALDWQRGRLGPDEIKTDTLLPYPLGDMKTTFEKHLTKTLADRQADYITLLKKRSVQYRLAGKDRTEIQDEIAMHTPSEAAKRSRYVKLQSEETEGANHAVIAELNILDSKGEIIPQGELAIHSASSFQRAGPGGVINPKLPKNVLDGDIGTIWHSLWAPRSEVPPFPHWIAIDLGKSREIGGFRLKPREFGIRNTDFLKWRLFTSKDGEKWTEVAQGTFDRGPEWREFLLPDSK